MATRMLIDARHSEETRVAVLKGNRIEEFDFESAEHKQIKGNIYLAKVTRVEPSLQAAFVDFGGNRHGFLAFSEIHPDYYQIPKDDRDALLAEEQTHAEEEARLRAEDEGDDDDFDGDDDADDDAGNENGRGDDDDESSDALADELAGDALTEVDTSEKDDVATIEDGNVEGSGDDDDDRNARRDNRGRGRGRGRGKGRQRGQAGSGTKARAADEARAKRLALRRRYKIQDVIQRRQVLLVQVVKEERGNKGAALTTYLSLAGRYCVLMPNSSHGGGISRKISSGADRKRLKQIVSDLELPKSMGCIIRTAGLQRTKTEIKRDFDYLARLWDEIRENTLSSSAPAVIHSDSDLIKRAIRDIYNREIEEVIVEGPEGYRAAKEFMKLLMPSHARRVKQYADPVPLFQRYGAEDQLSAMYDPVVQLKSGGYLVINPTEALVSIDINSGRSTREHGIEQTALATNIEAAKEIARQLRLRDMAGLVVIDFIDMEQNSSVRKVERCMKDSLKNDRARIQVGRISGFGLMEMSRQRLRTGVLEATTRECPHCDGTGLVRTASSAGLSALRQIEDEAAQGKGNVITLFGSTEAAIYMLNQKRADLAEIEQRYGVSVEVIPEGEDEGAKMRVSSSGPKPTNAPRIDLIQDDDDEDEVAIEEEDEEEEEREESEKGKSGGEEENADGEKRRRRRRRGGRRNRGGRGQSSDEDNRDADRAGESSSDDSEGRSGESEKSDGTDEPRVEETASGDPVADGEKPKRSRRRRAPKKDREDTSPDADKAEELAGDAPEPVSPSEDEEKPKKRRPRRKKADLAEGAEAAPEAEDVKPVRKRSAPRKKAAPKVVDEVKTETPDGEEPQRAPVEVKPEAGTEAAMAANDSDDEAGEQAQAEIKSGQPPRRGWWQRTFGE